ncbi:MAG: hypothetical protein JSV41_05000 [Gemmatimonadota bacterium]|nr:MAG: hypothetical protein JSV41_05000 [Gemmatimonadota bacterium]
MKSYRATIGALLAVAMLVGDAEYGVAQTGQMPMPDNHQTADFWLTHGQSARRDVTFCAACHAREYCSRCHVNASEVAEIQALRSDPGVADYLAGQEWPAPPSHTPFYVEDHRAGAASTTGTCTTCHVVEQQCNSCHSGSETLERRGVTDVDSYHPLDFIQRHSASAWNQENECASCHNPEVFCRSCHTTLGFASRDGRTNTGFHNKTSNFLFGHGQAARQGLELCASCHAQQDCLQCHSARAGRRVNPHGPGFDAEKLRSKNEGLCLFCHFSVPGGP